MVVILNQMAPVSGNQMCTEDGTDGSGPQTFEWLTISNSNVTTFQFLLNGSLAADMTLKIQGCLSGGEDNPEDLVTVDASGSTVTHTEANVAYDRFRVVVTAQTSNGELSQVLCSSRS